MVHPLVGWGIQEGSKLLGGMIKNAIIRSAYKGHETEVKRNEPVIKTEIKQEEQTPVAVVEKRDIKPSSNAYNPSKSKDEDYRWECCAKHGGAAAVLLKEAYERAIGPDGMGEGTAEKVMQALNEHAGMESDLEAMLSNPDAKDEAAAIMDAVRQFRRAAWDSRITTGGGTKDDIADAKLWNDIIFQRIYDNAKKHVGTECVRSGM